MESRLAELESMVAFLDDTVQGLNAVVVRQQHEIEQLRQQLTVLRDKLKEFTPELVVPQSQETPPPHY